MRDGAHKLYWVFAPLTLHILNCITNCCLCSAMYVFNLVLCYDIICLFLVSINICLTWVDLTWQSLEATMNYGDLWWQCHIIDIFLCQSRRRFLMVTTVLANLIFAYRWCIAQCSWPWVCAGGYLQNYCHKMAVACDQWSGKTIPPSWHQLPLWPTQFILDWCMERILLVLRDPCVSVNYRSLIYALCGCIFRRYLCHSNNRCSPFFFAEKHAILDSKAGINSHEI